MDNPRGAVQDKAAEFRSVIKDRTRCHCGATKARQLRLRVSVTGQNAILGLR